MQIVQNAAEEYIKLCNTLHRMIECLPRAEIYAETLRDSESFQGSVEAFYSSILRFWTRACKFYRRRRLWRLVRFIWNDYEVEFGELEREMIRCRDQLEGLSDQKISGKQIASAH